MNDIVQDAQRRVAYWRYIATNAAEIGIAVPTLDMPGIADMVDGLLAEIARLRLTDAEREALVRNLRHGNGMWLMHVSQGDKAVIDALLERHANGGET